MKLTNKVIAITGAGRGIGRGIATFLAQSGAHIAAIDINENDLAETIRLCNQNGPEAKAFLCDIRDESQVESTFAAITSAFSGLHGLVNNAGITRDGVLVKGRAGQIESKLSLADWQAVIDINLTGTFLCGREAAARMIETGTDEGVIVNISSVARVGNYGVSNYSATKAGVAVLAEVWARELARYNIRAASIAPGIIDTPMLAAVQPAARERLVSTIPLQRLGQVGHIARGIQFIFENDYFTGRCLEIDGGMR